MKWVDLWSFYANKSHFWLLSTEEIGIPKNKWVEALPVSDMFRFFFSRPSSHYLSLNSVLQFKYVFAV